jgi:hypothetical protein
VACVSAMRRRWSGRSRRAINFGQATTRLATIAEYSFGRLLVNGDEETHDLIVLPGRVVRNWRRRDGHRLGLGDLADVIDELPAQLIVGTGAYGRLTVDPHALERLRARGIDVEALPTADAVDRYRQLDPDQTAAALHLTC